MAAGDFRLGPPLPLPMTNETLTVGREHLARLAQVCDGPVGLENLAFAFSTDDVGTAFATADAAETFRDDFYRVSDIARRPRWFDGAPPRLRPVVQTPRSAPGSAALGAGLMAALDEATSVDHAVAALRRLDTDLGGGWGAWIDHMDPHMVATAIDLMRTWGRRNQPS